MIRRHTPTHKFRRAAPQTVHVTFDLRQGQANAAGQEACTAQGFGGRLPTAIDRGL